MHVIDDMLIVPLAFHRHVVQVCVQVAMVPVPPGDAGRGGNKGESSQSVRGRSGDRSRLQQVGPPHTHQSWLPGQGKKRLTRSGAPVEKLEARGHMNRP